MQDSGQHSKGVCSNRMIYFKHYQSLFSLQYAPNLIVVRFNLYHPRYIPYWVQYILLKEIHQIDIKI